MTNSIAEIEASGCIFVIGSNTTACHPLIARRIFRAKERGAKLIVADPRNIQLSRFADVAVNQRLGSDVALLNGMMHIIIRNGWHVKDYIAQRTEDYEALEKTVNAYTPQKVQDITGVDRKKLERMAELYATHPPASLLYAMGITQHTTGVDNVKSCCNLAMLCGNVGVRGGGVNPLRGQNNVQGACDFGGLPDVYSGYQKVIDPAARQKMEQAWGVEELPDQPGLKVTQMIPAAHDGKLKAFYIIGENPLVSDPDLNHCEKSIENLDFLVVQDLFMTETARFADVVLPSACYAEKEGTFTNSERRVQRVRKAVAPPGQAWDDWKIFCDIATRMNYPMKYENSRQIMEEISRVTPSYAGINYDRIEYEGIHWPCPTTEHPGTPILHREQFTCGKGNFIAIDYLPPAEMADDEYPMYLTTGRLLYHYHTGTMTMKTGGLNEIAPECFVEITPKDAGKYDMSDGSLVDIASRRGKIQARIKVSKKAVSGTVFIPFHYALAAANRLTNAALDPISGIHEYKVCAVKLTKAETAQSA